MGLRCHYFWLLRQKTNQNGTFNVILTRLKIWFGIRLNNLKYSKVNFSLRKVQTLERDLYLHVNTYFMIAFLRKGMLLTMFQTPLKWVSMQCTVFGVGFSSNFIFVRNSAAIREKKKKGEVNRLRYKMQVCKMIPVCYPHPKSEHLRSDLRVEQFSPENPVRVQSHLYWSNPTLMHTPRF